jgi:imidazolonepropionase-like amidohydrolase
VLCCRLTNTQFSMDELTAIVQEAAAAGTYVAAHAYTPAAITRTLAAGVRSIEHGNWLDEDTAQLMAGALSCCDVLASRPGLGSCKQLHILLVCPYMTFVTAGTTVGPPRHRLLVHRLRACAPTLPEGCL